MLLDLTALPRPEKTIRQCTVATIPAGSFPKNVTVTLPGVDGEQMIMKYYGQMDIAVNDTVSIRIPPGSNVAYLDGETHSGSAAPPSGSAGLPVDDTTSIVRDPVDTSKEARIDVGAVATSTTRVLTVSDQDGDIVTTASPTDGQIPIGSTSTGRYSAATLTAGANTTITNSAGGITISATGGGGSAQLGLLSHLLTGVDCRGIWLFNATTSGGDVRDHSGNDVRMSPLNTPTTDYDTSILKPFYNFDGTNQAFNAPDSSYSVIIGITGTESRVVSTINGLMMTAFVYFDALGSEENVAARWDETTDMSYRLYKNSSNNIVGTFTSGGTSGTQETVTSSGTVSATTWYALTYRIDFNNSEHAVFIDTTKTTSAITETSIHDNASDLKLGTTDDLNNYLDGRMSMFSIYAAAMSDAWVTGVSNLL